MRSDRRPFSIGGGGAAAMRTLADPALCAHDYELRLLGASPHCKTLRYRRTSDDAAKLVLLDVKEPYDRFELWRGTETIAEGPRLIIGG